VRVRLSMRVGVSLAGALLGVGRTLAGHQLTRCLAGAVTWMQMNCK
jgi:hypothetical protein